MGEPTKEKYPHSRLVALLTLYLVIMGGFVFYSMLVFWPVVPGQATDGTLLNNTTEAQFTGSFAWVKITVSQEVRVVLLVAAAGALGAVLHCLRSLFLHVAALNDFNGRWTGWYITRPFMGAFLGLIFYVVFRAGFLATSFSGPPAQPIGFIALAFLVGMFSEETFEKLKTIAEGFLARATSFEEAVSGQTVPDDGPYVVVEHLKEKQCAQKHEIQDLKKNDSFPPCSKCNEAVRWKLIKKT